MIGVLLNTKFATIISVVYRVDPRGYLTCESEIILCATELAGNRLVRFVGRIVESIVKFIRQPQKQTAVQRNRKGRIL